MSSHTSPQKTAYLTGQNIELMGYPPYSPHFAPNAFFLFPHIKNKCMFWMYLNRNGKKVSKIGSNTRKSVMENILKNSKVIFND